MVEIWNSTFGNASDMPIKFFFLSNICSRIQNPEGVVVIAAPMTVACFFSQRIMSASCINWHGVTNLVDIHRVSSSSERIFIFLISMSFNTHAKFSDSHIQIPMQVVNQQYFQTQWQALGISFHIYGRVLAIIRIDLYIDNFDHPWHKI